MMVNFFSTDRDDIEIGSVETTAPIKKESFGLDYNFKNKWSNEAFLKIKIFLRSIDFESTNHRNIKINLDRTSISQTGVALSYSSRNSSTYIRSLAVDLIIFDAYNPSFRYAEGFVSQNYISFKLGAEIPTQGVEELRTFIVGITSF